MESSKLRDTAARAAVARQAMLALTNKRRTKILYSIAHEIERRRTEILAAGALDIADAEAAGLPASAIASIAVTDHKLSLLIRDIMTIADMPDPFAAPLGDWRRPNGLQVIRRRVPVGLVGLALEWRPHVVAIAAAICFKSGNALMIAAGGGGARTAEAFATAVRAGGAAEKLPEDAFQFARAEDGGHLEACREMLSLSGLVSIGIVRGGAGFVEALASTAKVPILKHSSGLCHIYIDCDRLKPGIDPASAELPRDLAPVDLDSAVNVAINSRLYESHGCTAANIVYAHKDVAARLIPKLAAKCLLEGVELRGDAAALAIAPEIEPAAGDEWTVPQGDNVLAVGIVDSLEAAIEAINKNGSHISDVIISEDDAAIEAFTLGVDSAAVYANASSCFTHGGELGLGADIGISTDKLGARGPITYFDLTTAKYVILGTGQTRVKA